MTSKSNKSLDLRRDGSHPLASLVDSTSEVDTAALTRFSDEGFAFAARVQLQPRRAGAAPAATAGAPPSVPAATRKLMGGAAGATSARVTPDGSLYVRQLSADDGSTSTSAATSGFRPPAQAPARKARRAARKLLSVLGSDGREEVPMLQEHTFPFSAVGSLEGAGCTATLVNSKTLLTGEAAEGWQRLARSHVVCGMGAGSARLCKRCGC